MDYLYFDIECSDGNHICSLGYVLCDENFNVLAKDDLLINPQCAFRLGRFKGEPYIKLAYSHNEFRRNPPFNERYGEIVSLLTAPNRVLFGHSISSDLKFLEIACDRYSLPQLDLSVYDTQKIYAAYSEDKRLRALEAIVSEIGADCSALTEHKSCDDAEMAMYAAREVCARKGCTIGELIAERGDCLVNKAYMEKVHRDGTVRKVLKNLRKSYPGSAEFPSVFISESLRENDLDGRIDFIKTLYKRGYRYAEDIADCKYYLCGESLTPEESARLSDALAAPTKITTEELSRKLGTEVNDFAECRLPKAPPRSESHRRRRKRKSAERCSVTQ